MAASFPTSIKSFPTRASGQTINSSLFNEPQEEIVAIESFLLNGSTIVYRSSTGHIFRHFANAIRVILSSSPGQVIATGGAGAEVAFTAESFDANTQVDLSSTPTRVYPGSTGYYQCAAHATWSTGAGSTGGYRQLRIVVYNGSTATVTMQSVAQIAGETAVNDGTPSLSVSDLVYVPSTSHFIGCFVAQNSGTNVTLQTCILSAVYVGE